MKMRVSKKAVAAVAAVTVCVCAVYANVSGGLRYMNMDGAFRWRDGSVVQAQEYRGDILVAGLGVTIPARITLLGEEYLVGRGVVDRLRMTFDHGQRLLLEA